MPTIDNEYGHHLRRWHASIATHLGWDANQVISIWDDLDHSPPSVSYRAVARQPDPLMGRSEPYSVTSDGESTYWRGQVVLADKEAADLLETVGPKPRLMTREQELMLKGMLYKDEHA